MTLPQFVPFQLDVQVRQFAHFKNRSLELLQSLGGSGNFINQDGFRSALYMIDIGQNDFAGCTVCFKSDLCTSGSQSSIFYSRN